MLKMCGLCFNSSSVSVNQPPEINSNFFIKIQISSQNCVRSLLPKACGGSVILVEMYVYIFEFVCTFDCVWIWEKLLKLYAVQSFHSRKNSSKGIFKSPKLPCNSYPWWQWSQMQVWLHLFIWQLQFQEVETRKSVYFSWPIICKRSPRVD